MKKLLICALGALALTGANAAGFGIYEASARGNAVGGTLIGTTGDATANYYNPANISESTNVQVAAGVTFINPYCDVKVNGHTQERMNPGWFTIPTFYVTIPLPWDFTFGWGNYTEYGLGTRYGTHWKLAGDTQKTTMRQMTLNPNLSYKITDRWSVAGGLRASWIQFANHKSPYFGDDYYYDTGYGTLSASDAYHLNSKLKGDDWGMGWLAATSYKVTDDLSFGLVYRSQIKHKIKGNFDLNGDASGTLGGTLAVPTPYGTTMNVPAATVLGDKVNFSQKIHEHKSASAKLRLPRSITAGANWSATEKWRLGAAVTWTEWSSVKVIDFNIPGHSYRQRLNWNDVWRFGFGTEYDILDWLTVRGGYSYDMDPSSKHNGTTMIPSGDRHIIGTGLGFKITENLHLDFGYSFIRMNNDDRFIKVKDAQGREKTYKFATHNGFSHLVSATIRYSF